MRWGLFTVGIAALLVSGCAIFEPEFNDAFQVEGHWVSDRSQAIEDCRPEAQCTELVAVATAELLRRHPDDRIASVRLHGQPSERSDGTLSVSSLFIQNVVFTLEDGSRRLEWFQCAIDGRIAQGKAIYEPFCPKPMLGEPEPS